MQKLRFNLIWFMQHRPARIKLNLAWIMPRWLVYLCAVRLIAHATTGQYGETNPGELRAMEALERWGK